MEKNDSAEEYSNWKKKEGSRWSKISKQIRPVFVFIIAILIFGGNYLVTSGQMSRGVFFVVIISFGIVFLFLIFKESNELRLIPEHIIKQIVREKMEQKRKEGHEIPFDAKIKVTPLVGSVYETDIITGTSGVIKREVGLEVIRNGLKKSYVVSVHPFNGTLLDIIPKPLGIRNKDALGKDRTIIPVQFLDKGNV